MLLCVTYLFLWDSYGIGYVGAMDLEVEIIWDLFIKEVGRTAVQWRNCRIS